MSKDIYAKSELIKTIKIDKTFTFDFLPNQPLEVCGNKYYGVYEDPIANKGLYVKITKGISMKFDAFMGLLNKNNIQYNIKNGEEIK